jgi:hypothetical protein
LPTANAIAIKSTLAKNDRKKICGEYSQLPQYLVEPAANDNSA